MWCGKSVVFLYNVCVKKGQNIQLITCVVFTHKYFLLNSFERLKNKKYLQEISTVRQPDSTFYSRSLNFTFSRNSNYTPSAYTYKQLNSVFNA